MQTKQNLRQRNLDSYSVVLKSLRNALKTNAKQKRNTHNFKLFLKLAPKSIFIRQSWDGKKLDSQSIKEVSTCTFMNRKVFFFYFLRFIIYSFGAENIDLGKAIRLGVLTDQTLHSHTEVLAQLITWTEDFNKNYSVLNWTRVELVPVSVSKNISVNSTVNTICNSLFPRNVLGILSLVEGEKLHLLTTLAGVFDTPFLGISRSISPKNKVSTAILFMI